MKIFSSGKSFLDWHKHPFAVPVVTFLILFVITCVVLINANAQTIGASDSKIVNLYIDGKERIVPTRAESVRDLLASQQIELGEGDVVEPAADAPINSEIFHINLYKARPVTVVDEDGKVISAQVADRNPSDIAKKVGLKVYPEDKVVAASPDEAIKEGILGEKIVIERSLPVKLSLYGVVYDIRTQGKTVAEMADEQGIKYDNNSIHPAPKTVLKANDLVFITDPGKQIITTEEVIPRSVEYVESVDIDVGESQVREPGADGKRVAVYEVAPDGTKRLLQDIVVVHPVRELVARGARITVSNPSANVQIGQRLAAQRGWSGSQFQCLYQLWQKESKWSHTASNGSSGAYGIPQAYPGTKMSSVGADWRTNPETQINWGLNYISGSYGSPCGAWSKSQASGWY
jgi:uncharacterized protein YabE (DUF348 family)